MTILERLYWEVLLSSSEHKPLGATILWNAMYHLEPASGRIPTFHREWHSTRSVTNDD